MRIEIRDTSGIYEKRPKLKSLISHLLSASSGQSMVEYILVVFLVALAVFQTVKVFGAALNLAFLQAINNVTLNIK